MKTAPSWIASALFIASALSSLPACLAKVAAVDGNWLVLKCHLTGTDPSPVGADATIENIFRGKEGIQAYFHDISYGVYTPEFNIVNEWKTLSDTPTTDATYSRGQRIQNCVDAFGIKTDSYQGVVVMRDSNVDAGNSGNVLLDLGAWNVTFAAHEMGHTLGLGHSFDLSDRKNSSWSAPGEYFDYWDIMSAMAVYDFTNTEGLTAGPDMDTSLKMQLGWMPEAKLKRVSLSDVGKESDFALSRYDNPNGANPLAVLVSLPSTSDYYSIEYRPKSGWDRAIPRSAVMIHLVKGDTPYLILEGDRGAGDSYQSPEGLHVDIVSVDDAAGAAKIRLTLLAPPTTVLPQGLPPLGGQRIGSSTAAPKAPLVCPPEGESLPVWRK